MNPASLYGAAKLFNEFLASSFEARYGLEIPLLRIAGANGMGTAKNAIMSWPSKTVSAAVLGKPITLPIKPMSPHVSSMWRMWVNNWFDSV